MICRPPKKREPSELEQIEALIAGKKAMRTHLILQSSIDEIDEEIKHLEKQKEILIELEKLRLKAERQKAEAEAEQEDE